MTNVEEMGPIDYLIVAFGGSPMTGEAFSRLVDLVERRIIRVLDLVFVHKRPDGSVTRLKPSEVPGAADILFQGGWRGVDVTVFDGASSGLLDEEDVNDAGKALEPGTLAGILVYENVWAGPFAAALRRSGGQLIASGRIPVQAILAALDATEPVDSGQPDAEAGKD